jgi:hypothetical protein
VAFERDHRAAMRYLAEKLREIRLVEFAFPDNPVTSGGHGPRRSLIVSDRVKDVRGNGNWGKRRVWTSGWDLPTWKRSTS